MTKLEYRTWRPADEFRSPNRSLGWKSQVLLADYRFRVNADQFDINPRSIATQIDWTGALECRITIQGPAPAETLAISWERSAATLGLRTEEITTTARAI